MSFRMSSDDTVTRVSGEGPRPSPGGIAGQRHSERHVRSEKISPFITTVN
jgi:hypothetical protein